MAYNSGECLVFSRSHSHISWYFSRIPSKGCISNGDAYVVLMVMGRSPRSSRTVGSMSGVVKKYTGVFMCLRKVESQDLYSCIGCLDFERGKKADTKRILGCVVVFGATNISLGDAAWGLGAVEFMGSWFHDILMNVGRIYASKEI